MARLLLLLAFLLTLIGLTACDTAEPPEEPIQPRVEQPAAPGLGQATEQAWELGADWLRQTRQCAGTLHARLERFLDAPGPASLVAAQDQWHTCHRHWHHSAALRALGRASPDLFATLPRMEFLLAAPVVTPGYLDSVEHYPHSGIVNDTTVAINARSLRRQHGLTADSDVALGLYALEFLLWGDGPERWRGYRTESPAGDNERAQSLSPAERPNNRRRALLRLVSHLWQDDLDTLLDHWHAREGTLGSAWQNLAPEGRLQLLQAALETLLSGAPEASTARLQALRGLDELLATGEPPLGTHLAEDWPVWRTQLAQVIEALQARVNTPAPLNAPALSRARDQQLQALADSLAP